MREETVLPRGNPLAMFRLTLSPNTLILEVGGMIGIHYTSRSYKEYSIEVSLNGHPCCYQPRPTGLIFIEQTELVLHFGVSRTCCATEIFWMVQLRGPGFCNPLKWDKPSLVVTISALRCFWGKLWLLHTKWNASLMQGHRSSISQTLIHLGRERRYLRLSNIKCQVSNVWRPPPQSLDHHASINWETFCKFSFSVSILEITWIHRKGIYKKDVWEAQRWGRFLGNSRIFLIYGREWASYRQDKRPI